MARRAPETSQSVMTTLAEMCLNPVRVTMLDPITREQVMRMPGILAAVCETEVVVDFLGTPPDRARAQVTVEVLSGGDLYWFHSHIQRAFGTGRLAMDLPEGVHSSRRSHPRIDLEIPVRLLSHGGRRYVTATLRDLSAGGASIRTETPLQEGDRVTLVFALGSGMFLRDLEMEVVRCLPCAAGLYVVGLRFHCDPKQEVELAAWVQKQLSKSRSS